MFRVDPKTVTRCAKAASSPRSVPSAATTATARPRSATCSPAFPNGTRETDHSEVWFGEQTGEQPYDGILDRRWCHQTTQPRRIAFPGSKRHRGRDGSYLLLPNQLILGPRLAVPLLELALFLPLALANPKRMTKETKPLRLLSIGLVLLIALANTVALVLLVDQLVHCHTKQGGQLLLGAGQVWVTNMIVFTLPFWELDRGGPVRRTRTPRAQVPPADFRFPQDEDHDAIAEVAVRSSAKSDWPPAFLDYLYVSVTNSSAFSPTDTMPLSHRAKMIMATQSVAAITLSVLVIAKGVSLLG